MYEMSSDLVIRTTEPNRDMFLFRVRGRTSNSTQPQHNHGLMKQDGDKVMIAIDLKSSLDIVSRTWLMAGSKVSRVKVSVFKRTGQSCASSLQIKFDILA